MITGKKNRRQRIISNRQEKLDQNFAYLLVVNFSIILIILIVSLFIPRNEVRGNNEIEEGIDSTVYESTINDHHTVIPSANASNSKLEESNKETVLETETELEETTFENIEEHFCRNFSDEDKYLLAKIAMAEAEGESLECKMMVIFTVLNRVSSSAKWFPDTIEEVIFQHNDDVYQFSPVAPGGRWYRVEPNEECWEAVEIINSMEEDISNGALYFESCKGESWHSRNLELICKIGPMKFYK